MSMPQRMAAEWRLLWLVLAGLGLVGAAIVSTTMIYSEPLPSQEVLRLLVVSPLWMIVGAIALSARPGNRTGLLMIAFGAAQLPPYVHMGNPAAYTATRVINGVGIALAVHLVLAFPVGRLTSWPSRVVVVLAYVDVMLSGLGWTLVTQSCAGCPPNLLLVQDSDALRRDVGLATLPLDVFVLGSVAVILVRRWRSGGQPTRHALAPVLWAAVTTAAFATANTLAGNLLAHSAVSSVLGWGEAFVVCAVPLGFLDLLPFPWAGWGS